MQKKDVAAEVGVNPPTLSVWFSEQEFKDTYDSALRQMLADMIPDALAKVQKLTSCGNEWGYSNKVVDLINHMAKVDAQ